MLRVLAAAFLLSACSAEPCALPVPLRQDEVLGLVWAGVLGEDAEPPAIEWVRGELCRGAPAIIVGDVCAAGTYGGGLVRVVISERAGPFSSSAIVHELTHAHLDLGGDADAGHARVEAWALVPFVNEMLEELGL